MKNNIALGLGIVALILSVVGLLPKQSLKFLGSSQLYPIHLTSNPSSLDQFFAWGGIEASSTSWLSVLNVSSTLSVAGATSLAGLTATTISGTSLVGTSVSSVNGTNTSTLVAGSSAIGVNPGKLCLWNGTQFSIISFAAGTTTLSVATSTSCQ